MASPNSFWTKVFLRRREGKGREAKNPCKSLSPVIGHPLSRRSQAVLLFCRPSALRLVSSLVCAQPSSLFSLLNLSASAFPSVKWREQHLPHTLLRGCSALGPEDSRPSRGPSPRALSPPSHCSSLLQPIAQTEVYPDRRMGLEFLLSLSRHSFTASPRHWQGAG